VGQSLAARISALMLAVMLATGASAALILGQLRELRASHDLLTAVYVPFQEQLTEARVVSAKIHANVVRVTQNPLAEPRESELAGFADLLDERTRLVEAIQHPLDEALAYPDRVGGEQQLEPIRRLRERVGELESVVASDEGAEPQEILQDARHQSEIDALFKQLGDAGRRAVQAQRDEVVEAANRAEQLTLLVTIAGVLLAALATVAVVLTLRPLRKLSHGVRRLGRGDWEQRIELTSTRAERDDEVSRLAREFNLMADALEERERRIIRGERLAAVGQLASQITHEIRNPLSSVALNVELLEDELGDASPEARQLFARIGAEVDRLTSITEAYLGFTRRPRPALVPVDLDAEIEDLLEFLGEEHELAGIDVVREGASQPAWVMGDAGQLRQAMLNLLRNAREAIVDASDEDPTRPKRIVVRVECKDDAVRVVVQDSGGGITVPEDERDRIFEAFFTDKAQGTGLGLPTVQEILADHEGSVRVASTGPQGTVFELRLPACDPPSASVSSQNSP
jgi:signal transduction histidine kinase